MSVMSETARAPEAVSGIQLAQGIGVQPAKGFWADAWAQVLRRRSAVLALAWLATLAILGIWAPLLASGHPIVLHHAGGETTYPLLRFLRSSDVSLVLGFLTGVPFVLARRDGRAARLGQVILGAVLIGIIVVPASFVRTAVLGRELSGWLLRLREMGAFDPGIGPSIPLAALIVALALGAIAAGVGAAIPLGRTPRRLAVTAAAVAIGAVSVVCTWSRPLENFNYIPRETSGEVRATYTLIPFSPSQRFSSADRQAPGTTLGAALDLPAASPGAHRRFWLGTDAFGQDVLAQLIWASRLAISIGLVSTGIAVVIGVTIGAVMGYFGGWVDMILFRVVEIFMAVPLLFLLIVAAAVLPPDLRTAYTMMAIIGCFTWTSAARFTRAEFMKLRSQDFVQSARAVGLPLPSLLFKHMLPNGVTPVLVDASFSIAAAIAIEATLSYLGLGPVDQASWGKLLSSAMSSEGQFKWWLAVFPGLTIFLTVLSYNLLGEALRDAIDPKLKKARV
jgi:peptide/nickel transport system permease protein